MLVIYQFKLYRFTKILPESVMVGFLNGIGILIIVSQVRGKPISADGRQRGGSGARPVHG